MLIHSIGGERQSRIGYEVYAAGEQQETGRHATDGCLNWMESIESIWPSHPPNIVAATRFTYAWTCAASPMVSCWTSSTARSNCEPTSTTPHRESERPRKGYRETSSGVLSSVRRVPSGRPQPSLNLIGIGSSPEGCWFDGWHSRGARTCRYPARHSERRRPYQRCRRSSFDGVVLGRDRLKRL